MNPNDMMKEIAAGLRDVIHDTPLTYLKEHPEDAYTDLANRLILRLSGALLTIVPTQDEIVTRIQGQQIQAARRIFEIFTRWMQEHPGRHYVTGIHSSGRFEIIMREGGETIAYFQGFSAQDACAQAAQAICLDGNVT